MSVLAVVEVEIAIQVLLELGDGFIYGVAKSRGEKLFLDGSVEALAEAVGLRRADFGAAMGDLADGEEQFEVVLEFTPAELSTIVREKVLDLGAVFLIERQHSIVEDIDGRHRNLRQVQFGEAERACASTTLCM